MRYKTRYKCNTFKLKSICQDGQLMTEFVYTSSQDAHNFVKLTWANEMIGRKNIPKAHSDINLCLFL